MTTRPSYGERIHEIRAALARESAPRTCAELLPHCPTCSNTSQIAELLAIELRQQRVTRTGTTRPFAYALTAEGRRALDNPNYLRRSACRSRAGRRRASNALADLIQRAAHHG